MHDCESYLNAYHTIYLHANRVSRHTAVLLALMRNIDRVLTSSVGRVEDYYAKPKHYHFGVLIGESRVEEHRPEKSWYSLVGIGSLLCYQLP